MNNEEKQPSLDEMLANIELKYKHKQNITPSDKSEKLEQQLKSKEAKMSNSLDDSLAEIQAKIQNKSKISSPNNAQIKPSQPSNADDFLAEIENKLKNSSANKTQIKSSNTLNADDLLGQIQTNFQEKKSSIKNQSQAKNETVKVEDYLQNLTQNYQAKKQQNTQVSQQQNLENIRQEELNKQRRQKELIRKAEQWLKNLDPNSDEGFWFEQFAMSYESKLEAAMEYIKALNPQNY